MNENGVGKKHIEFVKKIPVPRLFNYQKLMARVNQIDIGDLCDVKEVLCQGLSEEYKVNGKFRNLQQLLLKMAQFYFCPLTNTGKISLIGLGREKVLFKLPLGEMGLHLVRTTKL